MQQMTSGAAVLRLVLLAWCGAHVLAAGLQVCGPGTYLASTGQCEIQPVCPVGYGVSNGSCTICWPTQYNDVSDNLTPCLPLRNCASQLRCLIIASDGTTDNSCSSRTVHNLSTCAAPVIPSPFFAATSTSASASVSTIYRPVGIIVTPSQTEVELWALSLTACCALFIGWLFVMITRRFQLFKHDQEERIRELASSNTSFNQRAIIEATTFLENRLGSNWPALANSLLKEHPEQPVVEYVNADMKNQRLTAKVACVLDKWKQLRGGRRNLNELLDSLYSAWCTRLVHDLCQALVASPSLAEFLDQSAHRAVLSVMVLEDGTDFYPDTFTSDIPPSVLAANRERRTGAVMPVRTHMSSDDGHLTTGMIETSLPTPHSPSNLSNSVFQAPPSPRNDSPLPSTLTADAYFSRIAPSNLHSKRRNNASNRPSVYAMSDLQGVPNQPATSKDSVNTQFPSTSEEQHQQQQQQQQPSDNFTTSLQYTMPNSTLDLSKQRSISVVLHEHL